MSNSSKLEKRIVEEIEKTKKNILDYKEMAQPIAPENAIGRISRMDAINNKSVTEAALRQAEEKLKKLNFMLTQIDKDDFGLCARCKQPIPIERLIFLPQSSFCVRCAH